MKFGVGVGSHEDSVRDCMKRARLAEETGADFIGFGDTQVIFRDCYSVLTSCALSTEKVHLGPTVTNPLTRHPIILANTLATIDEASGGRAYMAIGAGASAVANASMQRAKPKEIAEAIRIFRSAFRLAPGAEGKEPHDESVIAIKYAKRKVPVIVHASGPLGFKVAAEHGDALLVRLGDRGNEELSKLFADVREMHENGPRAGLPFDIWIYAPQAIADTMEEGRAAVSGILSARAVTLKPELCPPEYAEAFQQYVAQYDYKYHASMTEPKNYRLLQELGLADYMFRRFSLVGNADHVYEQISALADAGVTHLIANPTDADFDRAIINYGAIARRYKAARV